MDDIEKHIEDRFLALKRLINAPARAPTAELLGLMERIQVELLLSQISRRRRQVYRAYIDLLEAEVDLREDAEDRGRSGAAADYVKRLIEGLTD